LAGDQIDTIARGAFLHDIGKMAIPDQILRKPGKLNDDEREIMREHCYRGYHMLKKIPFLTEACEIVHSHHEHYDGSGYPRGLRSKEIPLGARIVAVANTLDSITSNLPYRSARSLSEARREIQAWAGRQLDPEVVRVFMTIPDLVFEDMRRQIKADSERHPYSFFQSVSATNSSKISCNRWSRRALSPAASSLFLPLCKYRRFASLICAISSRNFTMRSLTGFCMTIG
jgi:putative nucleotidyltransferase with HDIG domain